MKFVSRSFEYCRSNNKVNLIMVIIGVFCLSMYLKINLDPNQIYLRDTPNKAYLSCPETVEHLRNIVQYVEEVTMVLDSLNITNFLMYGSLWGVYRFEGPLPWDYDADIGIIGKNYNKDILVKTLEKRGFRVRDDVWRSGALKLRRGNSECQLDIFVFNNYFGTMKRPGLETWFGFIHYNLYQTFPAWMVRTPLPTRKFAWLNARVPRGGREIFKHLYPFNWRDVFVPTACRKNGVTLKYLSKFIKEKVNERRTTNPKRGRR